MARVRKLEAVPLGGVAAEAPVVSVAPPKRRRPTWVLLGVVLVGVAALLGAYVFQAVTEQVSVMVAAHDLVPGEPIGPDDLRVIEVGASNQLRAIQPGQQELILGLVPRGVIPAGTVLNTGLFVARAESVPAGHVIVGGSFEPGAVPVPNLEPGDRVRLIAVADTTSGDDGGATPQLLGEAEIWAVEGSAIGDVATGAGDRVWISLVVPEGVEADVAQAAAGDLLRLALVESS